MGHESRPGAALKRQRCSSLLSSGDSHVQSQDHYPFLLICTGLLQFSYRKSERKAVPRFQVVISNTISVQIGFDAGKQAYVKGEELLFVLLMIF